MVKQVALLSLHSSPLAVIGSPNAGGMNVYVKRLADELATKGIGVDVFTRRTDPHVSEVVTMASGARIVHVTAGPHRELPKSVLPLHIPAMASSILAHIHSEGVSYDALHSHYWLSGLAGIRVREHTDAPLVHMFHTLARVKEFHSGQQDPRDSALRFGGERCVLEEADAIVGATSHERDQMRRLYGVEPQIYRVIPPGVDVDLFQPVDAATARAQLGIDAERVILFVGRSDRIKGLDLLLASMKEIVSNGVSAKLLVVSDLQSHNRIHTAIRRLGLQPHVELRDLVPQAELPQYYSAADLCAVPSAYESFGMVALESMACQTPVVAFAVGGLTATIRHGETGFLARPGDPRSFSSTLQQALACADLEVMGRRARLSAQRFRWSTIAARTVDLYNDTIQDRLAQSVSNSG